MKIGIYPGSFDPITNGHIDIIKRSLQVFDKVIILIAVNGDKQSRFSIKDRMEIITEALKECKIKNVNVDSYDGLTVDYAKKHSAHHLIRGLRAVTDFEYEFQLNSANNYINNDIDTIFFMSNSETTFINSSTIISMYNQGVDISKLVPNSVIKFLKKTK